MGNSVGERRKADEKNIGSSGIEHFIHLYSMFAIYAPHGHLYTFNDLSVFNRSRRIIFMTNPLKQLRGCS